LKLEGEYKIGRIAPWRDHPTFRALRHSCLAEAGWYALPPVIAPTTRRSEIIDSKLDGSIGLQRRWSGRSTTPSGARVPDGDDLLSINDSLTLGFGTLGLLSGSGWCPLAFPCLTVCSHRGTPSIGRRRGRRAPGQSIGHLLGQPKSGAIKYYVCGGRGGIRTHG
jgi:hypothetical protein